VFQDQLVGGAPQRQDPGPGSQVMHGHPVQPAVGGDLQPGHQERHVTHVEGVQHVQAEGGAHEPRCGQRRGRTDQGEAEAFPHRAGELRVEDPEHDRRGVPARAELVAHGQTGLQVGQVVAGHDGHGGGAGQPDRLQGLRQRGISDDRGHAERPQLPEVAVVLALLHDHDVAARGDQLLDDLHPDRAQADDQDVPAQPGDPLPSE